MTGDALLSIRNVSKRFRRDHGARRRVARCRAGEFFALLGPSGCGKTTLMRLVAGFETPDRGRILLAGQDLAGAPPLSASGEYDVPVLCAVSASRRLQATSLSA